MPGRVGLKPRHHPANKIRAKQKIFWPGCRSRVNPDWNCDRIASAGTFVGLYLFEVRSDERGVGLRNLATISRSLQPDPRGPRNDVRGIAGVADTQGPTEMALCHRHRVRVRLGNH